MRTTVNLTEGLAENTRKAAASRKPARFRLITAHGRLVNPATDLSRASALIARDDEDKYSLKVHARRWGSPLDTRL